MSGTTSDKPIGRQPGATAPDGVGKRDIAPPITASDSAGAPGASALTNASSTADKSAAATPLAQKSAQARVPAPPAALSKTSAAPPVAQKMSATSPVAVGTSATTASQKTVKCPKCGSDVREVARFCQRCHHTMRYECPSCHNQQRTGGKCEKCGIDFLKYIGAVVTQKQAEADVFHERMEQRSTLMKNILWIPFTLGIPIIRDYFVKRDRKK
jgi:hypothetical protein